MHVRASQRLTDSAACLVASGSGPDRELDRLLARQAGHVGAKPILEVNTRHSLVKALADAKLGKRDDDVVDIAELLARRGADSGWAGARGSGSVCEAA